MIPIIFAVSILLFPTQIASYFATPPGSDPNLVSGIAQDFGVDDGWRAFHGVV